MGHLGFEPRTNRLKAEYSSAELMSQKGLNFQGSLGSRSPTDSSNITPIRESV